MEEDANIDSKFSTWTVVDSPLFYVNFNDKDLVCCKGGIHQVVIGEENGANELTDSEDDIFKASDVLDHYAFKNTELKERQFESKVVFKYKKPAIAFDSFVTDKNELIIFSLHAKKTTNSSQHKSTLVGSTLFYVEITSCEETIFKCIHPCVAAVEIKSTETPEVREAWILAVKAERITPAFVNEMIGQVQRNSFDVNGYAIFASMSDDPNHIYVAFLMPDLDVVGEKEFARVQYRQKISTKPFFLFDDNIFKLSSQNSSSDLYLNDEAAHALSLLLASSRDTENRSVSIKDIRDVRLSQGTLVTLDCEGAVCCYSCGENNLIRRKAPVFGVAFMSLGESKLSLITKTGSLYRLQLPLKKDRVSDVFYKCDARVDDIVEASEVLKKLSKEKDETELILNQLKFLLRMEKGSEKFPFEVSFRVVESDLESTRTTFRLILGFTAVKEFTELPDSFLSGRYWHLLVRFLPYCDQTQYHEAIAVPSSLDWSAQSWTCNLSIPEACLRLPKLPIDVKLSLCLSTNDVSVPSASFHQFQLRSLDFLRVKSCTRNACLVKGVDLRDLSTENDTFETFLQKMNNKRPIFNMVTEELGNTTEKVPSFEVRLERSLITSSKTLQLFSKLNELFLQSSSDELRNVCFYATLFDAEVSVVLQETSQDDIILSFSSRDFEGLRQLKAETSLLSFRGISFSKKSYVEVPSSVVSRLVDLKHLVKNLKPTSETLRLCHDYLRCQLSTQLP